MLSNVKMSNTDFRELSRFIYAETGIKLPPVKKVMLESRLQKRLKALQLHSFDEYCGLVLGKNAPFEERVQMINLVTTNTTHFFREPAHFDFLQAKVLPELVAQQGNRTIRLWSAGCSSGEEPYTLAMMLKEYAEIKTLPDFNIFATDISIQVLQKAITAIYPEEKITDIPLYLRRKYLLKSKDRTNRTVRFSNAIRTKIQFGVLNFMDESYQPPYEFDVIFCRNVLIYFDKEVQQKVICKLCQHLRKGGYFFLGHSESVAGMKVPLEQIRPTVFRKM